MTSEQQSREAEAARLLLQRAQEAVNAGEPLKMLEALTASGYLGGLRRRLQQEWDSLPSSEVDECVAQAVDAALAAASRGRRIGNLGGWLWKAARNVADDKWRSDYSRRGSFEAALQMVPSETFEGVAEREALREARRKEGIRVARELLPRLGQGQVVAVMAILIDAVENELPDLPPSSIAEQVGISEDAARTLVSRGLRRLGRLAGQEGVEVPMNLPDTDTNGVGGRDNE
ncbi:MAG: hypothetical protein OXH99_08045 [Bryobacterales bacterium]|nr:hypothetical protein [Bryobacterales bacterium]